MAHTSQNPADDLYAQLFDVSPFPAVVSRLKDHTVLGINASTAELFGIRPRDAVGVSVSDYYVDPSERILLADRLKRDGRADGLRLQIKKGNGDPLWEVWGNYTHELQRTSAGWKVTAFTFVKTNERGNMWVKTTPSPKE